MKSFHEKGKKMTLKKTRERFRMTSIVKSNNFKKESQKKKKYFELAFSCLEQKHLDSFNNWIVEAKTKLKKLISSNIIIATDALCYWIDGQDKKKG